MSTKIKYLLAPLLVAIFIVSNVGAAHASVFTKDLYFGMKGDSQVSQLQDFLTAQNLYTGPINGNFFFLTLKAVKAFQSAQGINPAAGYFGPLTRAAAEKIAGSEVDASNAQAVAETGSTPTPSSTSNTLQLQLDALLKQMVLLQSQLTTQQQTNQTIQNLQGQVQQQTQTLQQIQQNTQAIQQNTTPITTTPTPPPTPTLATPFLATINIVPVTVWKMTVGGPTQQMVATMLDQYNNPFAGATITWNSDNTATATINASGVVTAVGAGNTGITASSGGIISKTSFIFVYPSPTFALASDTVTTPYNQNVLGPVSMATLGTIKVTTLNEPQKLRDIVLTGVISAGTVANYLTGVALFDGTTQVTNFVAPVVNVVTFTTGDIFVPTTFPNNTIFPKTLEIVGNVISPLPAEGTTLYWTIGAGANQFRTTGITSGVIATNALVLTDLRTNIGAYNEGGTYTFRSNVLEIAKSTNSPSGTIGAHTFGASPASDAASFTLEYKGANTNLGVNTLVFTTNNLPALVSSVQATGVLNDAAMFRLYDIDAAASIPATRFLNQAAGTISFSGITGLTVTHGIAKHISIQVNTTDQAKWTTGTSMGWSIRNSNDVSVSNAGGVGFGGAIWSIPIVANFISMP